MALFRLVRELLSESLETTVIVKDKNNLAEHFGCSADDIVIKFQCFDARCGWFSHLVSTYGFIGPDDKFARTKELYPIGYLSEPLD